MKGAQLLATAPALDDSAVHNLRAHDVLRRLPAAHAVLVGVAHEESAPADVPGHHHRHDHHAPAIRVARHRVGVDQKLLVRDGFIDERVKAQVVQNLQRQRRRRGRGALGLEHAQQLALGRHVAAVRQAAVRALAQGREHPAGADVVVRHRVARAHAQVKPDARRRGLRGLLAPAGKERKAIRLGISDCHGAVDSGHGAASSTVSTGAPGQAHTLVSVNCTVGWSVTTSSPQSGQTW